MAPKFCHRQICLTSGFTILGIVFFGRYRIRCNDLGNHHTVRSLRFKLLLVRFFMPERIQKPVEPAPWGPKQGDGGGPRSPDVSRPDTKDLLKKMRKVDPNQSKRYRQRTGQ
jgi:hypothetical protein